MAKKKKVVKTNAVRKLESYNIDFSLKEYDSSDGKIDGISVANKIGEDPKKVLKTLVAQGKSKNLYVFCIPVEKELDLKSAANIVNEKSIEMVHVKDLLKLTGYVRGGCSPIGMKKEYPVFIDSSVYDFDTVVVSGGKIGLQIRLNPKDLAKVVKAEFKDIAK